MGFAGFMGDIDDEQERERQADNLRRIFERSKQPTRLYPELPPGTIVAVELPPGTIVAVELPPGTIVAVCEKCGMALTMQNWWKIGGKNLCNTHGKAYAEYLKS